ncbi:DUF4832 domain-containing protein [Streptomyces fimicarius]|uniref:DUF4832 domain-containing protein n=1 Tax=Streptomyces griseus TaxID=1911 RepID=UPI0036B64813
MDIERGGSVTRRSALTIGGATVVGLAGGTRPAAATAGSSAVSAGAVDEARAATVRKFEADTTRVLRNPLTGWVLYGSARPPADFWSHYDTMSVPGRDATVKVSDYAQTLYLRLSWALLNPSEGVYGWDTDDTLRGMIKEARRRGMRLALRVVVDSRDKHESFTPDYVREAGARGYETTTGSATVWSPYPDDEIFQKHYARFVKALSLRFDRPGEVDFIDGYGLGKWGEGHSLLYLDESNRSAVFNWNVDLYLKYFQHVPVAVNYHRLIGSTKGWGAPDPVSATLLNGAYRKGCVLRHDAFGMSAYYGAWEREMAATWKHRRPVILEGGWVTSQHDITQDPRGYETVADVRRGEYFDSEKALTNTMDFRVNETDSWFHDTFDLVTDYVARGGYRLRPVQVSVPSAFASGGKITINHQWDNAGWGYCPNNLPQWGYKYKVAFALLDAESRVPAHVFVDDGAEPSGWIAGTPVSYAFTPTAAGVKPGAYVWATALVDTTRGNVPGLDLAVRNASWSDGWLVVGACTVS